MLVTAASGLSAPPLVNLVPVSTAQQMCDAVLEHVKSADALIMAAAVADYRPGYGSRTENQKVRRRPLNRPDQDHRHPGNRPGQLRQGGLFR